MYGILKVSWGIDESHIYFYVYVYFDAFSGIMWLTIINKILIFEEKNISNHAGLITGTNVSIFE